VANKEFFARHGLVVNNNILVANVITGNVGVGTATPGYALDINGRINAAGYLLNGSPFNTMDYAYANSVGTGSNNYAVTVGAASNAWTNTVQGYSNSYAVTIGASSNAWANTTQGNAQGYANSIGTAANNWTNTVQGYSNSYAVTIGAASNTWANTTQGNAQAYANNVGVGANNQAGLMANAANSSAAATYLPLGGGTLTGSLVINQNLTVSGTTTYVNTQSLLIGDSVIVLNADLPSTAAPTENAGFEVNRGNANANAAIIWSESDDKWYITSNTWGGNNNWIASNADLIAVGTAANNQAGLMANAANAYSQSLEGVGNNWANTVAGYANTWANTQYGNSLTYANAVGLGANNQSGLMANASNAVASAAFAKANANNGIGNSTDTQVLFNDSSLSNGNSGFTFTKANSAVYIRNSLQIGATSGNTVTTFVTSGTGEQIVDTFTGTTYHSAFYFVTMNAAATDYHTTKLHVVHNDTTAYVTEFGDVWTANNLGTFTATYVGGTIRVNVIPTFTGTTIKMFRVAT
jgi:hypothetical protein